MHALRVRVLRLETSPTGTASCPYGLAAITTLLTVASRFASTPTKASGKAALGQVRHAVAIEIAHDQSMRKRNGQRQRWTEGSPPPTARESSPTGKSRRGENSAVWAGA